MAREAGINLVGDLTADTPEAQLTRQFLVALDAAGIAVFPSSGNGGGPFPVDLVCGPHRSGAAAAETWLATDFPTPYSLPAGGIWADRAKLGLPEGFLFLVVDG